MDRRPSYDEHPKGSAHRTPQSQHPNATYARAPRAGYDEESLAEGTHAAPPRHPHLDYSAVDSEGTGMVIFHLQDSICLKISKELNVILRFLLLLY